MLPVSYLALFAPIALALVARESGVGDFARREPGPCDVDACMDVIDSSACWNAVVMGNNKDLQSIFSCTAGGKTQVCPFHSPPARRERR